MRRKRRKGARMFLKRNHGWLIFFETIVRFVGERERNPQSVFWRSSAGQLLILGRENTIFSLYKFTLPQLFVLTCTQFALHFHCQAGHSKLLLCPSLKCSQYHILGVIFQRKWFSFPPRALKRTLPERRPCTRSVHACTHAYALYLSLCWANTPLCLTCFSCHDDERHLLFSAETPLHPMLPTSCLHYSQVEW